MLGSSHILHDMLRIVEDHDCVSEADVVLVLVGFIFGRISLEREFHSLS
jgi:hypothetical protein